MSRMGDDDVRVPGRGLHGSVQSRTESRVHLGVRATGNHAHDVVFRNRLTRTTSPASRRTRTALRSCVWPSRCGRRRLRTTARGQWALRAERRDTRRVARGVLYYGTSGFALIELDLDGGVLGQTRESIAALAVTPDGLTAYAAFVGNPVRLTRTNPDAGFSRDATFVPPPLSFVNALATRAGQVFAMGSANVSSPHYIHVLGLDGGLAATWGSMNAFDPDGFCTFSDAVLCGAQSQDVCIVDQNCPAFSQWTSQGQQRARLRFSGSGVQPFAVAAATNRRAWVLRGTPGRGRTLGLVSGL